MGKVIPAEHRFRDKKNKHIMDLVDVKKKELEEWFKLEYPEAKLEIFVAFSRNVGEELMIKQELKYKTNNVGYTVTSITNMHRRIWSSPYLCEEFLKTFVSSLQDKITQVMKVKESYETNRGLRRV